MPIVGIMAWRRKREVKKKAWRRKREGGIHQMHRVVTEGASEVCSSHAHPNPPPCGSMLKLATPWPFVSVANKHPPDVCIHDGSPPTEYVPAKASLLLTSSKV